MVEDLGYSWEDLTGESRQAPVSEVPPVQAEARAADVPTGLGEGRVSHPKLLRAAIDSALEDLERGDEISALDTLGDALRGAFAALKVNAPYADLDQLIGSAKQYVAARDADDDLDVIEARRHLQEAVIDYNVARWLAALDD